MLRYKLLYLILIIASIFAFVNEFLDWLNNEGKEYDLFSNEFKYVY